MLLSPHFVGNQVRGSASFAVPGARLKACFTTSRGLGLPTQGGHSQQTPNFSAANLGGWRDAH